MKYNTVASLVLVIWFSYESSSVRVDVNDDRYLENGRYYARQPPRYYSRQQIKKPKKIKGKRRGLMSLSYNAFLNSSENKSPYEYYTSDEDEWEEYTMPTVPPTYATKVEPKPQTTVKPPEEPGGQDEAGGAMGQEDGGLAKVDLSAEAWSSVVNKKELEKEEKEVKEIVKQWETRDKQEEKNVPHYGYARLITKSCYHIAVTYLNANSDLRDYYKIRFLYNREMVYEIGYIVHEIVYKYTVVLELFHVMQSRYYNISHFMDLAPPNMMLQFYIDILHHSQQIIHLCNTLNEIEEKYIDVPIDENYGEDSESEDENLNDQLSSNDRSELKRYHKMHKDRVKAHRKARKKDLKQGFYTTTSKTRRPTKNKHFPIVYGWSLEDW